MSPLVDFDNQFQSLLRLADDESPEMQRVVQDTILDHALPLILNRVSYRSALPDELCGIFNDLMREMHIELIEAALKRLADAADVDLENAMLILSYWVAPEIPAKRLSEQLNQIATQVEEFYPHQGTALQKVRHVNHELFEKGHFAGNSSDYYNPDNSFLHRLLETGLGLPITLSVLFILIAKRLSAPVFGVAMPSHFILKYKDSESELFFDPFNKGRMYSREECSGLLEQFNVEDKSSILHGCRNFDITLRILNNLSVAYSTHTKEADRVDSIERFKAALSG